MDHAEPATLRLEAEPACAARARRFAVAALSRWDLDRFDSDVALCATELATNAVLHSRRPFTVAVRPAGRGVRIDVQDERPDLLPHLFPSGVDPLASGTTGRGLRLIANLASRWGYFTTEAAKTVWIELQDGRGGGVVAPLVELAQSPLRPEGRRLTFLGLPVKAALASGIQVDDLVREAQMQPESMTAGERETFFGLLERSGPLRLAGRHAAFRAAAGGLDVFDLEATVTPDDVKAVGELRRFLAELGGRSSPDTGVPPEVATMREWLTSEAEAQLLQGRDPQPYKAG